MALHEWRDPTLVRMRLRQLEQLGYRLANTRQTGKDTYNMLAFHRLQEELFHTAQLLPPPPEKPYYSYVSQRDLYDAVVDRLDNIREMARGLTKTMIHWDDSPGQAKRPSLAEQLLGHLEITECPPAEQQRGRVKMVDHSTVDPALTPVVLSPEHGPL